MPPPCWRPYTRRYATRLDDEADALLAQLTLAAADESALNAACASHGCVGLYGYAQSAKAHRDIFSNESGWPLRLCLISEAELVQIFIAWTSASPVCPMQPFA